MIERFVLVDVSSWIVADTESGGGDEKVWLTDPRCSEWLFKPRTEHAGWVQGEDWAERIATELASRLDPFRECWSRHPRRQAQVNLTLAGRSRLGAPTGSVAPQRNRPWVRHPRPGAHGPPWTPSRESSTVSTRRLGARN